MSPQNVRYTGRDAARWLCQLAITVCMSGQGIAQAGTLLVFGDSLSDTGRVWATSQTTLGQELPPQVKACTGKGASPTDPWPSR
jgi:phospholipase/lecithinase/hemolysin